MEKYNEKEEINMGNAFEENWLDGMEKGMEKAFCSLVKDGLLDVSEAAKRLNITVSDFNEKMKSADI